MRKLFINRMLSESISEALHYLPVVTLTGPRQSGKTTLCRKLFSNLPYANLEDAAVMDEVLNDTKAFLNKYPNGVIIDEAQNYPELFSYLQVQVDEDRFQGHNDRHYIVTGSNNLSLFEKVSQSMAGRTAVMTLLPLSTQEILSYAPQATTSQFILNGGYPAVWTADNQARPLLLSSYYTTYVERDIRRLINVRDLHAFQTFIRMCAGRIGQEFNASSMSGEIGVSIPTIKHWLSILNASYIVHLLQPYYANIGKRLTKTPKLYFYDTGLAAFLLGITTTEQLDVHPLRGSLFENMVVNDFVKHGTNAGRDEMLSFYKDKSQHEVDIIRTSIDKMEAYEIKSAQTFHTDFFNNLNYIRTFLNDRLVRTTVIYDGNQEASQTNNGFMNFRHLTFNN